MRLSRTASPVLIAAAFVVLAGCRNRPEKGDLKGTLSSGGLDRTYIYRVPESLDPANKPWPLVVALHGRLGTGAQQEDLTHLSALADRDGFLVVYPDGVDKSWADGRPGSPAAEKGVDDVAFLSALIDKFIAEEGADPKRVYVTGFSNGGMMTHRVGCELSSKVAAIAPGAGLFYTGLASSCAPGRPVPITMVFGTEDPLMPYEGGSVDSDTSGEVLSAQDTRQRWADINGCAGSPEKSDVPDADPEDGTTITREAHAGCKDGSVVVLYSVNGGGHTWPGGDQYLHESIIGKTSQDMDASEVVWDFFQEHPLP